MADEDPQGMKVQMGSGLSFAIPVLILGLCAIPIVTVVRHDNPLDALRYFTLASAAVVAVLYAYAIFVSAAMMWRDREDGIGSTAFQLRAGRLARLVAVEVLLVIACVFITDRLGQPELLGTTPLFQLGLILLVLAWFFSERTAIVIERRSSESQLARFREMMDNIKEDR